MKDTNSYLKSYTENCCIDAEETEIFAEEMQDIAGVLSITANAAEKNIRRSIESILKIADRLQRKEK